MIAFLAFVLAYCIVTGITIGYFLFVFCEQINEDSVPVSVLVGLCWPISIPALITIQILKHNK